MRLLILGGTSEAAALARRLAAEAEVDAVLSLAGATVNPAPAPIPQRIGGFGGPEGLAAYLRAERIDAVVDATHPFAARMSANATAGCRVDRDAARRLHPPAMDPPERRPLGRGRNVDEAVEASEREREIVFLTQGRMQLGGFRSRAAAPLYRPRHRSAGREQNALPTSSSILARGPFALRRRTRADAERRNRNRRHQEQRRARDLSPRSKRRARSAWRSSWCRPAKAAGSGDGADLDAGMAWIRSSSRGSVGSRRQHPWRRAPRASDESRLARTDDDQRRHVDEAQVGLGEGRHRQPLVGAPDCAGESDRRRAVLQRRAKGRSRRRCGRGLAFEAGL